VSELLIMACSRTDCGCVISMHACTSAWGCAVCTHKSSTHI